MRRLPAPIAVLVVVVLALGSRTGPASAKDDRPPEVEAPAKVKPGSTGLLKAKGKGMRYLLRVPKHYDAKAGARLVVFLHGSNGNGLQYLRSFEAKGWCADDILCCPSGETDGSGKPSTDPFAACNFTFESAPLVADVTEEVQKALKTTITYVGGHSQGGFLTYSVIMNFPDLYLGALPFAGDCWMQNEPNLWESKPDVSRRQRDIAVAVILGRADPVVTFAQGQHAYDCLRAMGWSKVRLFAPERLNHMFMLGPVDEALEWLDAMNGRNEKRSLELAAKWAKEGEWGWVWNAAKASKSGASALAKGAEDAGAKAAPAMGALGKGAPATWIPKWIEFWRVFGATAAAKPLVEAYLEARERERPDAERRNNEAEGQFRAGNRDEAAKTLEGVLADGPHTYQGYFAWKFLSERK